MIQLGVGKKKEVLRGGIETGVRESDRSGIQSHGLSIPLLHPVDRPSKWGYLGKQNSVRYYTIISNKNDCRSVINAHNCEPDRLEISLMGKNCKNAENGFVIVLLIAPY